MSEDATRRSQSGVRTGIDQRTGGTAIGARAVGTTADDLARRALLAAKMSEIMAGDHWSVRMRAALAPLLRHTVCEIERMLAAASDHGGAGDRPVAPRG